MTEIERIVGEVKAPESIRRHERSTADADKFKEEMQKKLSQVQESDPEQQKKRKQQAEEEEETAPLEEVPPPPTPFDLQKQVNPLDLQEGGKISPLRSSQGAQTSQAAPRPYTVEPAPSSGATEEEMPVGGSSAQIITTSTTTTAPSQPQPQPQSQPQVSSPSAAQPSIQPIQPSIPSQTPVSKSGSVFQPETTEQRPESRSQEPVKSEQNQQQEGSSQENKPRVSAPAPMGIAKADKKGGAVSPFKKEAAVSPPKIPSAPASLPEKGMIPQEEISKIESPMEAEQKQVFLEGVSTAKVEKQEQKKDLEKISDEENEEMKVGPSATFSPKEGGFESGSEKRKKEEMEKITSSGGGGGAPPPPFMMGDVTAANFSAPPPYTSMSPEVFDIFERMAGVMTIMTDTKETETTITLDSPQFASSVFYGSQIIIREYATAPKQFNIEFNGSNPKGVALFQSNAQGLMQAFQYGQYRFEVKRIDTGHLSEDKKDKPLFRRKEKASGDKDPSDTGP